MSGAKGKHWWDDLAAMGGMDVASPAEIRERGRAVLAELGRDLEATEDAATRAGLVADLVRDPDKISALAAIRDYSADEWAAVLMPIRAIRGMSSLIREVERAVGRQRASERQIRVADPDQAPALPDMLPQGYRVPSGYLVTAHGVARQHADGVELCAHGPVYVSGRLVDVDTGRHSLRLVWQGEDRGDWQEEVVQASSAVDARGLVALRDAGCPVSSPVAAGLARYIGESDAQNARVLPRERVAGRCGWMPGGFLLGRDWVGNARTPVRMAADPGLEAVADSCAVAGTWEGWCEGMEAVHDLEVPWIMVWASVASVLLQPLGERMGFVVDVSGETSTGKSVVLEAALSAWGDPRGAAFATWEATIPGIEARGYLRQHLPVALDDTKHRSHKPQEIAEVIYMWANGRGRTRGAPASGGSPVGLRPTAEWLSCLLSTGEQTITGFTQDAGTRARTLAVTSSPFGGKGPRYGARAEALSLACREHYGHLGRRVVEWLQMPGNVDKVKGWLEVEVERYVKPLREHGAVPGRLGRSVALVAVASLVCHAVGAPHPSVDPMALLYLTAASAGADADIPRQALDHIYGLATARPNAFLHSGIGPGEAREQTPPGGWIGRWEMGQDWNAIDMAAEWVDDQLSRAGYDVDAVKRSWLERGWIHAQKGRGYVYRTRVHGRMVSYVRILREAVEKDGADEG